jgi:phage-related protein
MQFFTLTTVALSLLTQISAAPNPAVDAKEVSIEEKRAFLEERALIDARQTGPLNLINQIVGQLNTAVTADVTAINDLLNAAGTTTTALAKAVTDSAISLTTSIIGAATAIATSTLGLVSSLTAPAIQALTAVYDTLTGLIQDLIDVIGELPASTLQLVDEELQALTAVLKPFIQPLIDYAGRVKGSGANSVASVKTAAGSLKTALTKLGVVSGLTPSK